MFYYTLDEEYVGRAYIFIKVKMNNFTILSDDRGARFNSSTLKDGQIQ